MALSTGLSRGELLGLRWKDVELLERRLHVRQSFVRGEMTTPKSRAGSRSIPLGRGRRRRSRSSSPHAVPGARLDRVLPRGARDAARPVEADRYARKALTRPGMPEPFRPWHGLRHTALTETAAAGVPAMFVQAKAGHAQGSTTERYLHADRTSYPDAAELAEARLFGLRYQIRYQVAANHIIRERKSPALAGLFSLPGLDSNQQPSG